MNGNAGKKDSLWLAMDRANLVLALERINNMRNAGLCENGGEIVDASIGLCSCGKCPTPRPDYRK